LKDILDAHGGEAYWRSIRSIELEVSIRGFLFTAKRIPKMDHVRMTVDTTRPAVVIHDYPAAGESTHFLGEARVEIRDAAGRISLARDDPRYHFNQLRQFFYWDDLDFAYFSGYAMWNYLTMPFLSRFPGVEAERAAHSGLEGDARYEVRFPPNFPTHARHQVFYFDDEHRLYRHDYTAEVVGAWARAAHFCGEYRRFGGLVLPTIRRVYPKLFCNQPFKAITLVAIDIHQVTIKEVE
jgi:hypothetical protein